MALTPVWLQRLLSRGAISPREIGGTENQATALGHLAPLPGDDLVLVRREDEGAHPGYDGEPASTIVGATAAKSAPALRTADTASNQVLSSVWASVAGDPSLEEGVIEWQYVPVHWIFDGAGIGDLDLTFKVSAAAGSGYTRKFYWELVAGEVIASGNNTPGSNATNGTAVTITASTITGAEFPRGRKQHVVYLRVRPEVGSDVVIYVSEATLAISNAASFAGGISVENGDASVSVSSVEKVIFDGATVTDDTGGQVTVSGLQGPQGDDGAAGPAGASALTPAGDWDISTAYSAGDIVNYDGVTYAAITSTTGDQPDTSTAKWQPILTGTSLDPDIVDALEGAATPSASNVFATMDDLDGLGGGASYALEPGLKPPSSPASGDDEFDDANGTDPTTTGWSWGNQASCTGEIRAGRLIIDLTNSASRGSHGLYKAAPASGDWSVAIRCGTNAMVNYHGVAVEAIWGTLATPTELETVRLASQSTSLFGVQMARYTSWAHGGGINRGNNNVPWVPGWLRLRWVDATKTLYGEWSDSPLIANSWRQIASVVKATRPAFIGIAGHDELNVPGQLVVWADCWRMNWTSSDYDPTIDIS